MKNESSSSPTLARLSNREIELIISFRQAERAYQYVIATFAATVAAEHPFYGPNLTAKVIPFPLKVTI
jgi:hypothetical protein